MIILKAYSIHLESLNFLKNTNHVLTKLVSKMFIRVFYFLFVTVFFIKISYLNANDTPFKKNISFEEIGMCSSVNPKTKERESFGFKIDEDSVKEVLKKECNNKGFENVSQYTLKENYSGDFEYYDNCSKFIDLEGVKIEMGKYDFSADFFCEGSNPNLLTEIKPNSIVEKRALTNNCNFELSRDLIQIYSIFLQGIGNITRAKTKIFEENLDWLLFIYKDEQVDKFIDLAKISTEVWVYKTRQMQEKKWQDYSQAKKKGEKFDDSYDKALSYFPHLQSAEHLKEIFSVFLKIQDLSDIKLGCDEKQQLLSVIKSDMELYHKRIENLKKILEKGGGKNHLTDFVIPPRKFKFIKRYQTEADYQNPLYSNTVFKRSYNDKLAPSNGAERIANFAILVANIFAGTNITPLNTTESLGSMKLALRNLTAAQSRFLEALGEDQMAIAVKQYASNLAGGKALGKDNLDKILIQTKEYQNVINQKIKSGYILDNKAKKIFASGMSFYLNGIFNLVDTGLNVSQIVGNFSGGIAGVIQGIGLAFIAKDALTTLPLFFNSTGIIFDYANQSGIEDLEELEKAKDSLGV